MLICGDTHGKFKEFKKIAVTNSDKLIVQIGDFGLGFHGESTVPTFPPNALFFRGNHDNPAVCKIHPNYMGDYGSKIIEDRKVFWMGGAWSIDYKYRREGLSWWRDEELSLPELDTVMEQYLDFKPEIMITHDVCSVFAKKLLSIYSIDGSANLHPTRTGQALSAMFDQFQPKYWFCGHYHLSLTEEINGTKFQCLNELETTEI